MEASSEEAKKKQPTPAVQRKAATGISIGSKNLNYGASEYTKVKKVDEVPWSTGLFGCFSDLRSCWITCWCPWITFGRIAEVVDHGTTSCARSGAHFAIVDIVTSGGGFMYTCLYRSHLRQEYALEEGLCNDCLVHLCCRPCALCQEYRELQSRGFDLSLGWHGNSEENSGGELTAPNPPVIKEGKTPAAEMGD